MAAPVRSTPSPPALNCSLPFPGGLHWPRWLGECPDAPAASWRVCSPRLALLLPGAHISRAPHHGRGCGGSLEMKYNAPVLRCQIFPVFSNFVPAVPMETRGISAHTWSCLQVAVGYQGRSVMHKAAEGLGFSFPMKMLALS